MRRPFLPLPAHQLRQPIHATRLLRWFWNWCVSLRLVAGTSATATHCLRGDETCYAEMLLALQQSLPDTDPGVCSFLPYNPTILCGGIPFAFAVAQGLRSSSSDGFRSLWFYSGPSTGEGSSAAFPCSSFALITVARTCCCLCYRGLLAAPPSSNPTTPQASSRSSQCT